MNAQSAGPRPSRIRRSLAMVALGALACSAAATSYAQANARADQVRAYNAQVLQLQAELRRSGGAANGRAAQVLASRAAALRELMATDPTAAEKLAFPAAVLEQLASSFPNRPRASSSAAAGKASSSSRSKTARTCAPTAPSIACTARARCWR